MEYAGTNVIWLDAVDSTNEELARRLQLEPDLPGGTVIVAREQLEGKGMGTNSWVSNPGQNLTLSVLLRPAFLPARHQFYLSMAVSLGLYQTVKSFLPAEQVKIKWPNDLYAGLSKVAGILIRNSITGSGMNHSIVGIGLNVNQTVFPRDLPNPGSLKLSAGRTFDLHHVLEALVHQLNSQYERLRSGSLKACSDDYRKALFGFERWLRFRYGDRELTARIYGITESGQLLLETRGQERLTCDMKEIQYVF